MRKSAAARLRRDGRRDAWVPVLGVCAAAVYLGISVWQAVRFPLGMDEVMTLWLVRMPSVPAIYQALLRGGQYEPPAHPVFLHALAVVAGQSSLVLRLPSIVALLVAAMACAAMARRHLDERVDLLVLIMVLYSPLHTYAIQARPYTPALACFAVALWLWDGLRDGTASLSRLGGIAVLMAAALALHFYCALYFVSFAVVEILYALYARRVRWGVWLALFAGGASAVLWLPVARRISVINRADRGPGYYARPDLAHLARSMHAVMLCHLVLDVLLFSCCAFVVVWMRRGRGSPRALVAAPRRNEFPLLAIASGCMTLPFITFVFAREISGTYNDRYVLPGVLGSVLLVAVVVQMLPYKGWLLAGSALVLGVVSILHARAPAQVEQLRQTLARSGDSRSVVIAEGKVFLEAQEYWGLTEEQKARLVYLTLPEGYRFNDSTNENQVKLWHGIRPSLAVYQARGYPPAGGCFDVFDGGFSSDDLMAYLRASRVVLNPVASSGAGVLYAVCR